MISQGNTVRFSGKAVQTVVFGKDRPELRGVSCDKVQGLRYIPDCSQKTLILQTQQNVHI